MKKMILLIFINLLVFINMSFIPSFAINPPPKITAPSGILIDGDTGNILYKKNSNKIMYPASTTKMMTAILTLENANLKDRITIDKDTSLTDGSSIYTLEGEVLTVEQLLNAMLIHSANDAAVALAKHVSGNVDNFVKLMNKRAKELGAKNTHFSNPNGLPDDTHVTTAYDLAMIAKHGMTIPKFREIVKTPKYIIPPTNKQPEFRYLRSSNRFLWGVGGRNKINYNGKYIDIKYNIVDGIKTGYTLQAQQCLVTSAKKDNHRLISVVLNTKGSDVYADSRTLIDYGFENYQFMKIIDSQVKVKSIHVKSGTQNDLDLVTKNQLYIPIPKNTNIGPIKKEFQLNKKIIAPIHKGDYLGKAIFKSKGKVLGEVNLIASQSIPKGKGITYILLDNKFKILSVVLLTFLIWKSIKLLNKK